MQKNLSSHPQRKPVRHGGLVGAVMLTSLLSVVPSIAQESESLTNAAADVIIVTAQKRPKNVSDVALSVSVIDNDALKAAGVTNIFDTIDLAPGVTGVNPSNELTQVSVRGIQTNDYGIGSDPAIGVFLDDVYLGRNENTATTFIDLERIEIVRGPQGALFGRATPGGAISLVTKKPSGEESLDGFASFGTRNRQKAYIVGNTPVTDSLSLRGSFYYDHEDGFISNIATGQEIGAEERVNGRLSVLHDDFLGGELQLTGWFEQFRGDALTYRNVDETFPGEEDDVTGPIDSDLVDPTEDRNIFGAIARYETPLSAGVLVSITSLVGYELDYLEDFDGTPDFLFNYGQYDEQHLLSQELRFVSGDDGPLSWFAGVIGYREKIGSTIVQSYDDGDLCVFYEIDDEVNCAPFAGSVTDTFIFADARNSGAAVYGEATYAFTDQFSMSAGLRYTYDDKHFVVNSPVPGGNLDPDDIGYIIDTGGTDVTRDASFHSVQPRVAATYDFGSGLSAFAVISRGDKPGGFDTFDPFAPAFNEETVWNYEIGSRGAAFDKALRWALSAFYYRYNDLQVLTTVGPRDIVQNAGSARGVGVEAEVTVAPTPFIDLQLSAAYVDAKYVDFVEAGDDFSGNRLSYTPELALAGLLSMQHPITGGIEAFFNSQASYQTRQHFSPVNSMFASQTAYALADLELGFRALDDGWSVSAFVENVADQGYIGFAQEGDEDENFGAYVALPGRPRVIGVNLAGEF